MENFRICTAWLHIAKVGAIAMYDFLAKYAKEGRQVWEDYQVATEAHPLGGFGLVDFDWLPTAHGTREKVPATPRSPLSELNRSL